MASTDGRLHSDSQGVASGRRCTARLLRLCVVVLLGFTAAGVRAGDAVAIAVDGVREIYLLPFHRDGVLLEVTTAPFEAGSEPDTIFIHVLEPTSCCRPASDPANPTPLLEVSVHVRDERVLGISASGRLIEEPEQRDHAEVSLTERAVLRAIRKVMRWGGIASSETRSPDGKEMRRFTFRGRSAAPGPNAALIDARSGLPLLIGVP